MSRPIDPTTGPTTDQDTDPAGRAIRTLLAAASEDEPPTTDLLGKVRHRAQRRRALVPSLAALGAAGVLAVAVATSTVTTTPPASAQERVAAAVTRTAQDGYRIRAATSGTKGDREETTVSQGVYDPAGRAVRMVEVTPIAGHVLIFHLDGRVYVQLRPRRAANQGYPSAPAGSSGPPPTRTTPASPSWPTSADGRCSAHSGRWSWRSRQLMCARSARSRVTAGPAPASPSP